MTYKERLHAMDVHDLTKMKDLVLDAFSEGKGTKRRRNELIDILEAINYRDNHFCPDGLGLACLA